MASIVQHKHVELNGIEKSAPKKWNLPQRKPLNEVASSQQTLSKGFDTFYHHSERLNRSRLQPEKIVGNVAKKHYKRSESGERQWKSSIKKLNEPVKLDKPSRKRTITSPLFPEVTREERRHFEEKQPGNIEPLKNMKKKMRVYDQSGKNMYYKNSDERSFDEDMQRKIHIECEFGHGDKSYKRRVEAKTGFFKELYSAIPDRNISNVSPFDPKVTDEDRRIINRNKKDMEIIERQNDIQLVKDLDKWNKDFNIEDDE